MHKLIENMIEKETKFPNKENIIPVKIKNSMCITDLEATQIIDRYKDVGFVLFEYEDNVDGEDAVNLISKKLNLGLPFISKFYKEKMPELYKDKQITVITKAQTAHKAFNTDNEQRLHTDGTFTEIGEVKTTVLYCVETAALGGETILFDSVSAFYDLASCDLQAAEALFNPHSLRREGDLGFEAEQIGPAFAFEMNELITRFSIDNTSDWEYGFSRVENLKRAYTYLTNLAKSGEKYFLQFQLKKGQGIIMANDKIAHGRTSFTNDEQKVRVMTRGVYCNRPNH